MLTVIADFLTALLQLLKQKHLTTKNYDEHLLYERLQDGIDEDIDRIKEIALACGYNEDIANAFISLDRAAKIVAKYQDVLELEQQTIAEINRIAAILSNSKTELSEVFNEQTAKEAIINMLGDIAEKRTRDIYLLRFAK